MRKLSILFLIILLASMFSPQVFAESKKQAFSNAIGVSVVVDNNVDITYTGKTWKDAHGNNKYEYIARISQAPIYNDDGSAVDCSWHGQEDAYIIINNVFSAQVIGAYITTTYQGQSMSWNPIVMVDSKEYVAKGSPKVLAVDPINSNYLNNTLEWDYGVCVRRVRVIEGLIQETWVFDKDPKGTVWIKDNAQKSAGFTWAIAPYAYDADGNTITINQYKQVMAKDMATATYPVTIDPTEVYVTSASDGHLEGTTSGVYATARNGATGFVFDTATDTYIGQRLYTGNYKVYRTMFYFDSSALPDSATITAANVSLRGEVDYSTVDFNVVIQNGQPTYPSDPMVDTDWPYSYYNGDGGSKNTSTWNETGWNDIICNASGMSWISLIGTTKLCLRSSQEIASIAPSGLNELRVWTYEKGAGYRPYLEVTYSSFGVPTVTTNPATYVTKTTAQLNGYVNADGGEANTVSFNYQHWYNAGWLDCIEFTINASYVDADLTNFPVLVTGTQLNTTDTDFWTTVNSSGSDILFTASDGVTKLNRELVSINTTAKTMECYVNVTAVDDTNNTKFYMYYNSANISLYNESNSTRTWDADYAMVWHMGDNPNTSTVQDSTVNNLDGTKKGAAEPAESSGSFSGDKAQLFDGVNDYVGAAAAFASMTATGNYTATTIFSYAGGALETPQLIIANSIDDNNKMIIQVRPSDRILFGGFRVGATNYGIASNAAVVNNSWYSASLTSDAGARAFYKDGVAQTGVSATLGGVANAGFYVGSRTIGAYARFNGSITEVRVSNISRSAAWDKAVYYTMLQSTSFAPVTDVFTSTTTQSKNTGDSWYTSTSGLTANYLYGYKAEAVNSYGTAWGAWVWFNTSVTLNPPSNVLCNAGSNSIALSWTKGGNSSYTYIRYKTGGYPTSSTDGNAVANQSGVNFTHTGLASGTSYYYRLWGEDGGTLSTTNVTTMCTTTASGISSTTAPLPTLDTSGYTTVPNGSALTNNPLYPLGNLEAAAISVPQGTWWMLVGMGGLVVTGLFIYTRSRNLLAALGAMIIFGVVMANMGIFPIWVMYVFGLAGIGMSWKELR